MPKVTQDPCTLLESSGGWDMRRHQRICYRTDCLPRLVVSCCEVAAVSRAESRVLDVSDRKTQIGLGAEARTGPQLRFLAGCAKSFSLTFKPIEASGSG